MLRALDQYWHTLRHLRAVQFYGRLWFRLARPTPDLSPAPLKRPRTGEWKEPAGRTPSLNAPGEFLFLGEQGSLAGLGWAGAQKAKLWRYNQHYFDDLNAENFRERAAWHQVLIEHWLGQNPPGRGTGWEPYPTSLRIVNWIKWALADNRLPAQGENSLAIQTRWLSRRLEIHLLGNHLLANAKALSFAGLYFQGSEADGWLRTGEALLDRELAEQVLPDGGHFERSPMYHLIILEDLLDLVNLYRCFGRAVPDSWLKHVERMLGWSRVMRHPDGEIAFFNDAAFGIAPPPIKIDAYAARLGWLATRDEGRLPLTFLNASGYGQMVVGLATVFVDMAPLGPDYLPGHGHADTLSFELSLGGERLIVNGGTSIYGRSPERQRQRSTAAHSTVVVDGMDSSEVWSGFRVARRARITEAEMRPDGTSIQAVGAHDGYHRLPGRPTHRRTWLLNAGLLHIADEILGEGTHRVEIMFPLAPGFVPRQRADGGIDIQRGQAIVARVSFAPAAGGESLIEPTSWHPRFGESVATWRIRRQANGRLPIKHNTIIEWSNP